MGSFFSNASFRSNIPKEQIITTVKQALSENGIEPSFLMKINEQNNWVTIYDPMESEEDIFRLSSALSELLKTPVLVTQCCDSDFMLLSVSVQNDGDICSVGVPYGQDVKIQPNIEKWSALLPTPKDQESFLKIIDEEYIFSEECLEPLSEIIGFNPEDVNKIYEEAADEDDIIEI